MKRSQNVRNKGFSYYFCLIIDGSREPDPYLALMDPDPGGPKTYGYCGSGSAKLVPTSKVNKQIFTLSSNTEH
jgi:hypothetical protein